MKIEIRLIGRLEEYWVTDEPLELIDGGSVADALSSIGIPGDELGMVSMNGESVSKHNRSTTILHDGDQLTAMALIKGG